MYVLCVAIGRKTCMQVILSCMPSGNHIGQETLGVSQGHLARIVLTDCTNQ